MSFFFVSAEMFNLVGEICRCMNTHQINTLKQPNHEEDLTLVLSYVKQSILRLSVLYEIYKKGLNSEKTRDITERNLAAFRQFISEIIKLFDSLQEELMIDSEILDLTKVLQKMGSD